MVVDALQNDVGTISGQFVRKEERKKWLGGYIRLDAKRRKTFVIERRVGKKKFHVSTRCHGERQALEQLARFESNPASYVPGGTTDVVVFTTELIEQHKTWSIDTKGNTRKHANQVALLLLDWFGDLGDKDLRKLSLHDLRTALEKREKSRAYRIAAIKSFFSWLRRERGFIKHHEDVTLDMAVPQAVPEKRRRDKDVSPAAVKATLEALLSQGNIWAHDCLLVLSRTGWHVTELYRFAHDADAIKETPGHAKVLAVFSVLHKGGRVHRTSITEPEVLSAARRILAQGTLPQRFPGIVRDASKKAGFNFGPGVMRHTVATRLAEREDWVMDAIGDYLGHQDKRTTANFYANAKIPRAPDLPTLH